MKNTQQAAAGAASAAAATAAATSAGATWATATATSTRSAPRTAPTAAATIAAGPGSSRVTTAAPRPERISCASRGACHVDIWVLFSPVCSYLAVIRTAKILNKSPCMRFAIVVNCYVQYTKTDQFTLHNRNDCQM